MSHGCVESQWICKDMYYGQEKCLLPWPESGRISRLVWRIENLADAQGSTISRNQGDRVPHGIFRLKIIIIMRSPVTDLSITGYQGSDYLTTHEFASAVRQHQTLCKKELEPLLLTQVHLSPACLHSYIRPCLKGRSRGRGSLQIWDTEKCPRKTKLYYKGLFK